MTTAERGAILPPKRLPVDPRRPVNSNATSKLWQQSTSVPSALARCSWRLRWSRDYSFALWFRPDLHPRLPAHRIPATGCSATTESPASATTSSTQRSGYSPSHPIVPLETSPSYGNHSSGHSLDDRLFVTRLEHQSLLVQFDTRFAAELAGMHRAPIRSRMLRIGSPGAQGANSEEAP